MTSSLKPIASNLWTENAGVAQLLAGRSSDGKLHFPIPEGDSVDAMSTVELSPTGTLWSFTRQDFKPKPPYDGPEEFTPFLLGYIELPGQLIIESHIVGTTLESLKLGMAMEMVITPFDESRSTFAFKPAATPSKDTP